MATEYRLKLGIQAGSGIITVNGGTPQQFYEEGASLTIAIALDPGFVSVEWFANQVSVSTTLSFSYTMPSQDVAMRAVVSGTYAPIDGYGLKYFRDYGKSYSGADCWRLEIYQDGYGGTSSEIDLQNIIYRFGNLGIDPLETIVGSSLDITLAGTLDQFNEFLIGDNRTWKVILKDGLVVKFVGFLTPDFVTINDVSGTQYKTFTAVDGLKGFDSIRVIPGRFPTALNGSLRALIGSLNQSYTDFRPVNITANIYETRMNDTLEMFNQFFTPEIALFTEGQPIFFNGSTPANNTVSIKETLEALLKPFLCRVFLYDNEFWIIRTPEMADASFRSFKYLDNGTLDSTNTITNGTDIECDIDQPERTARRVFTEFNSILKLGKLGVQASGGVYETKFNVDDWFIASPASIYAGRYVLSRWDYVRARPSNAPSSVPSGDEALIQYVSDASGESCQIWTTTTTAGTSDPNISYIKGDTNNSDQPIKIAQETANKISFEIDFAVVSVSSSDPNTFANHNIGIMIKIGDSYMQRDTPTTFDWTLTQNIMEFEVPNSGVFNKIQIQNVLVPEDGTVEIRLYQLILTTGTRHQYTVRYKDLKLSIEENEALTLSEIAVKGITDNPYSNVHPDYETVIGDAETAISSSAIRLIGTAGFPVSELWSRDGVEELPLQDIIVQDLANLKGRTNQRLRGRMIRTELKPYKSYLYGGRYWVVMAFELDTYNNIATVDLFDLGEEPTT